MSRNAFAALADLSREAMAAKLWLDIVAPPTVAISKDDFLRGRGRRFGKANPQAVDNAFWQAMVRTSSQAYHARSLFEERSLLKGEPVWCFHRFGRSVTWLPDGRVVLIAGEHEDSYDPDFLIYNDVVVVTPETKAVVIYGYPRSTFPPTDGHTATFVPSSARRVPDAIYIIGNVGYKEERREGETPLYRLDLDEMSIHAVQTSGEGPGWVSNHTAWLEEGGGHETPESSGSLESLCAARLEAEGVTADELAATAHPQAAVDALAAAWAAATRRRGRICVRGGQCAASKDRVPAAEGIFVLDLETMHWSVRPNDREGQGRMEVNAGHSWMDNDDAGTIAGLGFLGATLTRAADAAKPPPSARGARGGNGHEGATLRAAVDDLAAKRAKLNGGVKSYLDALASLRASGADANAAEAVALVRERDALDAFLTRGTVVVAEAEALVERLKSTTRASAPPRDDGVW